MNQGPTGSSDPFALRRQSIGIIAMLQAGLNISLASAIDFALDSYEGQGIQFDRAAVRDQIVEFFMTRTKVSLKDGGCAPDTIEAVMATGVCEPAVLVARVKALETARKDNAETFDDLATAFARANNLRDAETGTDYDEAALSEVQAALSCAVVEAETKVSKALADDNYAEALASLAALRNPVDLFFEKVMVKDEDLAVRANNMKLLNRFVAVFAHVANFGLMAKNAK